MIGECEVTVVIAALNAAATIDATLASIVGQQVSPAHVVVIDDGSDDDTAARAAAWSGHLPIRVLRNDVPTGPGIARDRGIASTSTALLALLDADDVLLPDHLSTLVRMYGERPGIITPQMLQWLPGVGIDRTPGRRYRSVPEVPEQLSALLVDNWIAIASLFSRADYVRAGGYRADVRKAEDWDLWIRMVRNGVEVSRPSMPTALYRLRPGSMSSGDDYFEHEITLMQRVVAEAGGERERAVATRQLARMRSRDRLLLAYAAARRGDAVRARIEAIRALRKGTRAVRLRALMVAIMPQRVTEIRDSRSEDLARRLD